MKKNETFRHHPNQDLYNEMYSASTKEMQGNIIKRKGTTPFFWTARTKRVKMILFPKRSHRFHAITIKIPIAFLLQLEKAILKFIWNQLDMVVRACNPTTWEAEAGVSP